VSFWRFEEYRFVEAAIGFAVLLAVCAAAALISVIVANMKGK
jgi:hypothetical protein